MRWEVRCRVLKVMVVGQDVVYFHARLGWVKYGAAMSCVKRRARSQSHMGSGISASQWARQCGSCSFRSVVNWSGHVEGRGYGSGSSGVLLGSPCWVSPKV